VNGFLIDTNVLSELRKERTCHPAVRQWYDSVAEEDVYVSVLVLGEIRHGIERIRLRDPRGARALDEWIGRITAEFADRLLPIDAEVADKWGHLGLERPLPVVDGYLAATAMVHDLTLVSRDKTGFQNVPVRVLDPFEIKKPT
jgi:predicted nucleic acid-binding protein